MTLSRIYRDSLALLTDLYQLTMAYGYWKLGRGDEQAVFHLTFRKHPFAGGYTVAAGLAFALDYIENLHHRPDDLGFLATLRGNDDQPLLAREFLDYLRELMPAIELDAVPEGTVVFPHEPLVRVRGPLPLCQLLETPLLNMINFQSLIATKAARICGAARGDDVIEFGLRRAQGIDGALAASRAAYLGGCAATSNLLAGKCFGIPVRGTHAHSWVMSFDTELESFEAYAQVLPNNCVFLVDTYESLDGVCRAIQVGRRLRERGHRLAGIRLDSGDLAYLSIEARRMLDEAGFPDAVIVASNDLDEHVISSLKEQGAAVTVWGVGTRLATAHDDPAMGGVYKLSAVRSRDGQWHDKVKLSEQPIKMSIPGMLQVRRYRDRGGLVADCIFDERRPPPPDAPVVIVHPAEPLRRKTVAAGTRGEDLLVPVFRDGRRTAPEPPLDELRDRARRQLAELHPAVRRLLNPHEYPAGLELSLHEHRTRLILAAQGDGPSAGGLP